MTSLPRIESMPDNDHGIRPESAGTTGVSGNKRLKIGLNLLHARPEIGGGWNYIENVVKMLELLSSQCEFLAYCTPISAKMMPVPDHPHFRKRIIHLGRLSQVARIAFEQCILPFLAAYDKVQCLHWFANNKSLVGWVPSVATMYDFKFADRPEEDSFFKGLYLRNMARFACQGADILAPMSEVSARTAIRLFGAERERIVVINNPLDETFRPRSGEETGEFRRRFNLPSQFWLYVAHPYPHKNHARLFAAYKKFRETTTVQWPLVLRGNSAPQLDALARELGIAEAVVWLPRLSSNDMARLYSAATAMIFPSEYEGCGLPLLEAMACGCPVAASNIDASLEFAGGAALIFDAGNVEAILDAMQQFATQPALRQSCASHGLIKAHDYSAPKIAGHLLNAYRKACLQREAR